MLTLLKGLIVLLLLAAALVLGGGLLLASTFTVVRSTTVAAPPGKVYAFVADPRRWKEWTAWNQRDPAMQIEYFGAPSGAGAGWSWKSQSQGDGKMTFTAADPNRRVAYELFFPDFGTTSRGAIDLAAEGAGTRVTWTMNGDMGKNPLMRWFALFSDRFVGKDFEEGLAGLKAAAEK